MPTITVEVTPEVADALARQARALLIGRRAYVRAVLATIAEQAARESEAAQRSPALRVVPKESAGAARD